MQYCPLKRFPLAVILHINLEKRHIVIAEAYLEPCQKSKMERFEKIVNG